MDEYRSHRKWESRPPKWEFSEEENQRNLAQKESIERRTDNGKDVLLVSNQSQTKAGADGN